MRRARIAIRLTSVLLVAAAAAVLIDAAGGALVDRFGATWRHAPEDGRWLLSDAARALADRAYADLDGPVVDHRAYLLSAGKVSGDGYDNRSFVHERFLAGWDPRSRLYGAAVADAAGVDDPRRPDTQYVARLVRLARNLPGNHRIGLTALDQRYDADGRPRPDLSPFHVDNDYVADIAQRHEDLFRPVVSVHPYRRDAAEALGDWAGRGARSVFLWPALQGFDPDQERLDDYYRRLAELDLTLQVRTGGAAGLSDAPAGPGDPWALRSALAAGVRVVLSGGGGDTAYPAPVGSGDTAAPPEPGVAQFLRLLRHADDTEGELYADLGGLLRAPRLPGDLARLLQHPDAFEHLVYASAYPLPAVAADLDPQALARHGFVTEAQARDLEALLDVNPLLFDLVATRLMRLPHTDLGLPAAVFTRDAVTER